MTSSCSPSSRRRWPSATPRSGRIGSQLVVVSSAGDHRSTLLAAQRELGRRAVAEGDTCPLLVRVELCG